MAIEVKWSDHLELLADGLFAAWKKAGGLFQKVCVVVNDMATRDWLKNRFLVDTKRKQVLMNLDFVLLQEFVNDWLGAQVHGMNPRERKPAQHPYSPDILTWRIYGLLATSQEKVFAPLHAYIGKDPEKIPARRYTLAAQLARMYDDYLNSRFYVLRFWETNKALPPNDYPAWQRELYRRLYEQEQGSYASDYATALSPDCDASQAYEHGFPRYLSVHLFDIPFMSEPVMSILEKISEAVPMTAWSFNPCGDWLGDSPSKKEEIRNRCNALKEENRNQRNALKDGRTPTPVKMNLKFESTEERLLGALAAGARATLGTQIEWGADADSVLGEPNSAFKELKKHQISLHTCYSPRRELEVLKDALHDFFRKNPDAKPHDALVLCADWAKYAPVIEAVFGGDSQAPDSIPVAIAGGIPGESPLIHSFKDLLDFRSNRFQVCAVFNLLGIPSIAGKFGLDAEGVAILRDMVKKANIHWGWDDADVNATLKIQNPSDDTPPYPYTWQRGLDRLSLDLLCGVMPENQEMLEVENLGRLRPTGIVEGDRARNLKALWQMVHNLADFRRDWASAKDRTPQEWENLLLQLIDTFYQLADEDISEMQSIRRAITATAAAISQAQTIAGQEGTVDGEVFATAVLEKVGSIMPCTKSRGDAVLFAPLKAASATPHSFVWICGLNDGAFPSIQRKPSFNVVGRHPSPYDVDSRDRDAYAFLKGLLSARETLSLSYVGKNVTDNQEMPPSVLLNDFTDYLGAGTSLKTYTHPLHAFSPNYFRTDSELPPSYSKSNWRIAGILNQHAQGETEGMPETKFAAFDFNPDGPTILDLDELVEFYTRPNKFIFKNRLKLKREWSNELDDNTPLEVKVSKELMRDLILYPDRTDEDIKAYADGMVEDGNAPQSQDAEKALEVFCPSDDSVYNGMRNYLLRYPKKYGEYTCQDTTVFDGVRAYEGKSEVVPMTVCCNIDGHEVRVNFSHKTIPLQTQSMGMVEHLFNLEKEGDVYPSQKVRIWLHHLAGHAAGRSFVSVCSCLKKGPSRVFLPLSQEEAMKKMSDLVKQAFAPLKEGYPDFTKVGKEDPYIDAKELPIVSTDNR